MSGPILAGALLALPGFAAAQELRSYAVMGDAIPQSLTGTAGDVTRGRALVIERSSTCILCHSGPFPEQKFQGDLAPDLSGSGSRFVRGPASAPAGGCGSSQCRDHHAVLLPRGRPPSRRDAWRGKPILSAEQIEDIVAYLLTLRE